MSKFSYENIMDEFDPDEWNTIFNTIKASMESMARDNVVEGSPIGMRDALIFNEASQILGQTSLLYRFHKELQHYSEED